MTHFLSKVGEAIIKQFYPLLNYISSYGVFTIHPRRLRAAGMNCKHALIFLHDFVYYGTMYYNTKYDTWIFLNEMLHG